VTSNKSIMCRYVRNMVRREEKNRRARKDDASLEKPFAIYSTRVPEYDIVNRERGTRCAVPYCTSTVLYASWSRA